MWSCQPWRPSVARCKRGALLHRRCSGKSGFIGLHGAATQSVSELLRPLRVHRSALAIHGDLLRRERSRAGRRPHQNKRGVKCSDNDEGFHRNRRRNVGTPTRCTRGEWSPLILCRTQELKFQQIILEAHIQSSFRTHRMFRSGSGLAPAPAALQPFPVGNRWRSRRTQLAAVSTCDAPELPERGCRHNSPGHQDPGRAQDQPPHSAP